MSKGLLVVISAPSGAGKTTLAHELLRRLPNSRRSLSSTTRPPRNTEIPGQDYDFISAEKFDALEKDGAFAESANVHGFKYGTLKSAIEQAVNNSEILILTIDVQGARSIKASFPDSVSIFVEPPDFDILETRLRKRGTEEEEDVRRRLENARQEIARKDEFDFCVVNDRLDRAALEIESIIKKSSKLMAAEIPDDITLDDLKKAVETYYRDADFSGLEKAYKFSMDRHEGQTRSSGEAYITHPLSVAYILAELKLDLATITTGILHDTVEDTSASREEITQEFGEEVAFLVDGVTKLSRISFRSSQEKQAENFRKMLLAMAKDIRVILVKLADRTHNMRTLTHLAPHKQMRIAQETLDIYAPLANRLGISWMKVELEDLSLKYTRPSVYSKISKLVDKKRAERDEYISKLINIISDQVEKYGLKVKVSGRAKHFFSIFKKLESRGVNFEDIQDIVAFRVLTKSISECYEVLGIIHSFFKPVPGRFKDYIAMPKKNLYQSLHTTVIGPFGERLEVQIRTSDMHEVAESGVAAHWEYKSGKINEKDAKKFHWLRQLVDTQETTQNPSEFMDSVKLDLFMGDIYVFTPRGDLLEFPAGSTPLDFAYTIHTELGHKTTGAKVNGRIVPLKHKLRSGDTVDIITGPNQKPNKDWLKFVKTGRAKAKIRQLIRGEERDRARSLGRDLLDKEFRRYGKSISKLEKQKDADQLVQALSFTNFDEMLISVGYGKRLPADVVVKIYPDFKPNKPPEEDTGFLSNIVKRARNKQKKGSASAVKIAGMDEDILIRFGKCCHPLPGDEIVGYISRGRGITVHKLDCKKTHELDMNRAIDVEWESDDSGFMRNVKIKLTCLDKPGLLNRMSQVITNTGININSVNIRVHSDKRATGIFDLQVRDRNQLLDCIRTLEAVDDIISVERI